MSKQRARELKRYAGKGHKHPAKAQTKALFLLAAMSGGYGGGNFYGYPAGYGYGYGPGYGYGMYGRVPYGAPWFY